MPGSTMSHSVPVNDGSVDRTPNLQSSLAPGAAMPTYLLCVEKSAGRPSGLVAPTERPIPGAPRAPPSTAAGNWSWLPEVPVLPEAAIGSTSLTKASASARASVGVSGLAPPARLRLSTSAWRLMAKAMPRSRSRVVKSPSLEARMASTLVLPATPLPPTPLPSIAAIRPVTNVPWPTVSVTSLLLLKVSYVRATRPANSGWLVSRPVSMTAIVRREPPPAASRASAAWTSS